MSTVIEIQSKAIDIWAMFGGVLFNALYILGLYEASQPRFLLNRTRKWLVRNMGYMADPILNCLYCMPSVHGTIGYFVMYGCWLHPIYFLHIGATGGMVILIDALVIKFRNA